MKKYFGVLAILLLLAEIASAQYVLNSSSNGTTVNTCSGTFYDSGGSGSNYGNNQNYTITFCATAGCMMADFTAFNTQPGTMFFPFMTDRIHLHHCLELFPK
ncbi:MAG: hypothetical protein IPH33_10770 [Bacteroidetes bacterium]|nr:hypothetical protein [Bacteroidota bacterium]